ncbi:hypothetical protein [Pandoraea pnomenusa]|uniref:hypothetical protein n=1 Tax=Pandoraea pnomenusa TaxID=93220 RepID=UPI000AA9BEE0|nr:hypothetical protein [Pandoraea pnomenusa]
MTRVAKCGPFSFRGQSLNRLITQIGQSIYEWFFTKPAQDNMVALGKLTAAVLGTSPIANGLPCTPTSPATLQVSIGPGEFYALAALESTVFGTLPVDTSHQVVKQGILLDSTLVTCAPPSTAGQAINYLIEVQYQDKDVSLDPTTGGAAPVVLQYYNSSNPSQPWQGPNNSGQTSNTFRQGIVAIQAKAGIAAPTGTQATPSPDAGWTGLWVVTVANGQASITAGNIAQYAGAPILPASILPAIQANLLVSGTDTGVANACAVNIVPAVQTLTDNMVVWFKAKATNTGATTLNLCGLGAQPMVGAAHSALQGGEIIANGNCAAIWNANINSWVLLECTGGPLQVGTATQSQHAATLGQVQSGSVGFGQSWQNVLGSRAANTTYYNTTGKTILVNITSSHSTAGNFTVLTINGTPVYGQGDYSLANNSTSYLWAVPAGASYVVTVTGGTLSVSQWTEYR